MRSHGVPLYMEKEKKNSLRQSCDILIGEEGGFKEKKHYHKNEFKK